MKTGTVVSFMILFAVGIIFYTHSITRSVHAEQNPASVTATSYDYWDCDPQAAGGSNCIPRMKYEVTQTLTGDRVEAITELQLPNHPTQYHIATSTQEVRAFPEINAHWSLARTPQPSTLIRPTAQNGCLPSSVMAISTGQLLGHQVVVYRNSDSSTITSAAVDLNCYPLRTEFHFKDAAAGTTSVTYFNLEPASWFSRNYAIDGVLQPLVFPIQGDRKIR